MANPIADYTRFFSKEAINTHTGVMSTIVTLGVNAKASTVNLGTGMPNAELFPFEEATVTVCDGEEIYISPKLMRKALQYGSPAGYGPLLAQLRDLTDILHSKQDWNRKTLVPCIGSQHGLSLCSDLFLNDEDYLIVPEPMYSAACDAFSPHCPRYLIIPTDEEGMIPSELRKVLSQWDPEECRTQYSDVPKVMYLNPIGMNPNGGTMSTQRKRDIYQIASEYNILILEDDPYYYLCFQESDSFPTSFLKLDVDHRVIRFDSFSKIVSGGFRLGYITGPNDLLGVMISKMVHSIIHTPTLQQMILSELLNLWGLERFLAHTQKVRDFYRNQRRLLVNACNKYLKGLCKWSVPTGGFFLWLTVTDVNDTWEMILRRGLKKDIILVPGSAFSATGTKSSCIRVSFSIASEDQFDTGIKNLAELIKEERKIQNDLH